MTTEQFQKAADLTKQIADYKNHLGHLHESKKVLSSYPLAVSFMNDNRRDEVNLRPEFLNMEEFLAVYRMRLKAKIESLEKELSSL